MKLQPFAREAPGFFEAGYSSPAASCTMCMIAIDFTPFLEWSIWGSNPRPSDCEPDALPAELMPRNNKYILPTGRGPGKFAGPFFIMRKKID